MWKSFKARNSPPLGPKQQFDKDDRDVLRSLLLAAGTSGRTTAFSHLHQLYSFGETKVKADWLTSDKINTLCVQSSDEILLTYLELLMQSYLENYGSDSRYALSQTINEYFLHRGLLYTVTYMKDTDRFEIYPTSSPHMGALHEQTQGLLLEKGWEQEAALLSRAIADLRQGPSAFASSLKSVYSALESALKRVARTSGHSQEETEGKTISQILALLSGNGFFSGPEAEYIRHTGEMIQKMSAFIGGKRKEGDHVGEVHLHEVLFAIYGVDNSLTFLLNQLRLKKK